METTNTLKPTITNSSSFFNKFKKFIVVILLSDLVIGNSFQKFIENLNNKGLLGLGADFRASSFIWGNTIWLNILHLIIVAFTAGLFGFLFGYLTRRLSLSYKLLFAAFYTFISFIFLALFTIIIGFLFPKFSTDFNDLLSESLFSIATSAFNLTFFILTYIIMFASSFFFMKYGCKIINDPYYTIDKTKNGTLLDIKWYHYLWLFIPISLYCHIILNLIYSVGHTIVTLINNFKWSTIFGGEDSNGDNAIDVAWGKLIFIIIAAIGSFYLLFYLRKILIGETTQHWSVKVLIVIAISIIIPFAIFWFTI